MRHIQQETRARVNLRGKGSGHIEIGQREEQLEPLHILITADRPADVEEAKSLAEDLLDTVKSELDAARSVPAVMMGGVLNDYYYCGD